MLNSAVYDSDGLYFLQSNFDKESGSKEDGIFGSNIHDDEVTDFAAKLLNIGIQTVEGKIILSELCLVDVKDYAEIEKCYRNF